ncbi:MAG TPA: polymer-forming cytoskeletal protein [Rhodocyclaceae bacterium]|nr:polymer-forming cytoskeletal protein [Rhodocyclaceae bacterium]
MLNKGSIFSAQRDLNSPAGGAGNTPASTSPSAASSGNTMPLAGRALETAGKQEPQGAKLVVGPGVKLKGAEIQDCDTLLVEGRVEATMDSRFIQIADQGSFDGTVNIDVAEIRGRFSGELTAREQIIIHSTGRVSGKIRYGRIVVHEGGELSGDVKSITTAEAANATEAGATGMARLLAAKTA